MKVSKLALSALIPLVCTACAFGYFIRRDTAFGAHAEIQVNPRLNGGGYRTQAEASTYTISDVNHLVLKLFTVKNRVETAIQDPQGNPVQKDIAHAGFGKPVAFSRLRRDTTYRIRAYAYKAAGTAGEDLVSTQDARSAVDVLVTNDDSVVMANIPVQLIGTAFNGQPTRQSRRWVAGSR